VYASKYKYNYRGFIRAVYAPSKSKLFSFFSRRKRQAFVQGLPERRVRHLSNVLDVVRALSLRRRQRGETHQRGQRSREEPLRIQKGLQVSDVGGNGDESAVPIVTSIPMLRHVKASYKERHPTSILQASYMLGILQAY
jgi:hypothetical protein